MTNHTQAAPAVFQFQSQEVRVIVREGEPWFVAADICSVLGLTNSRKAIAVLDDDEKGVTLSDTLGGKQSLNIINESGMYALVLRSRDAMKQGTVQHTFRKWVTCEVLPSIRKTGGYQTQPQPTDTITWTYLGHLLILTMYGRHWVKMQTLANAMGYREAIPSNFYKHAKGHDTLYVHCQDENEQVNNPRTSVDKQHAYYRYLPMSAVYNIANRDSRGHTVLSQLERYLSGVGKPAAPAPQPTKAPADHFAGLPAGRYLVVVQDGEATLRDISACSIVSPEASDTLRRNMTLLEQQMRAFRGEAGEACMGTSFASLPEFNV